MSLSPVALIWDVSLSHVLTPNQTDASAVGWEHESLHGAKEKEELRYHVGEAGLAFSCSHDITQVGKRLVEA